MRAMHDDVADPAAIDPGTTILYPTNGGVMEALYQEKDWASTRIGPRAAWPQSLKTALGMVLASRFPAVIFWGEHLSVLYNETYAPIFGRKHPDVLGKPGVEAWGEVWGVIAPLFEAVMTRGETTWSQDQLLVLERNGFSEECEVPPVWWTVVLWGHSFYMTT